VAVGHLWLHRGLEGKILCTKRTDFPAVRQGSRTARQGLHRGDLASRGGSALENEAYPVTKRLSRMGSGQPPIQSVYQTALRYISKSIAFRRPRLPPRTAWQEAGVERHPMAGMTAIAVLNIIFGGVGIFAGVFNLLGFLALLSELSRLGVFELPAARLTFSLLMLATGAVGLVAGFAIFARRPWARTLSLAYAGLLILSSVFSYTIVPIISTIGTYDIGSIDSIGLVRLIIFGVIYIIFPVPYSIVLCVVFFVPASKATFAKVEMPSPALAPDDEQGRQGE
jgi:hypothetical protein